MSPELGVLCFMWPLFFTRGFGSSIYVLFSGICLFFWAESSFFLVHLYASQRLRNSITWPIVCIIEPLVFYTLLRGVSGTSITDCVILTILVVFWRLESLFIPFNPIHLVLLLVQEIRRADDTINGSKNHRMVSPVSLCDESITKITPRNKFVPIDKCETNEIQVSFTPYPFRLGKNSPQNATRETFTHTATSNLKFENSDSRNPSRQDLGLIEKLAFASSPNLSPFDPPNPSTSNSNGFDSNFFSVTLSLRRPPKVANFITQYIETNFQCMIWRVITNPIVFIVRRQLSYLAWCTGNKYLIAALSQPEPHPSTAKSTVQMVIYLMFWPALQVVKLPFKALSSGPLLIQAVFYWMVDGLG